MNMKEELICRLCLQLAENDFEIIDETIRKMLEGLLLKVNLDISKDPIICKECVEITAKYFHFKSACMDTKRLMSSFVTDENDSTLKLKDVYKHGKNLETVRDFICQFCSNNLSGSGFVLYTLLSDVTYKQILQELMPGMDFEINKNVAICTSCKQNLDCYSKFVYTCLDVEEKVTKYIQKEYIRFSGQVKLSEILHTTSLKNSLELDHNKMPVIKQEDMDDQYLKVEYGELIKTENLLDIKDEGINYNETACETLSNMAVSKLNSAGVFKTKIEKNRIALTQNSSFTPMTANYSECMCDAKGDCGIKCDMQSNIIPSKLVLGKPNLMQYKSEVTKKTNQMLTTKNVLEAPVFNCALCTHQTKHKRALKRHMLIHKDITEMRMYRCSMCIYETKYKSSLKSHMLIHKDITEVEIYKCSMCIYETKQKANLKRHTLSHKDITEVEMYKCSMCIYETKYKSSLKGHMLIHKDITEVQMYKCSMCVYETKHKYRLKSHMLIHKDVTEVKIYKCQMCTFETKHRNGVAKHMLVHKDITELEMYKCSMCIFETKIKSNLKRHMLVHKDITEVEEYKCSVCTFKTKCESYLVKHMVVHKDISELEMYKCSVCIFETKYKHSLKSHMLIHKHIPQVEMYKCSMCTYDTKRKRCLIKHMLVHKNNRSGNI